MFDDVLSAVDTHVAKHLREKVFLGRLRGKCIVLATHDEATIKCATQIVHMGSDKTVSWFSCYDDYRSAFPSEIENMKKKKSPESSDGDDSGSQTPGGSTTTASESAAKKQSSKKSPKKKEGGEKKTGTMATKEEEREKGNVGCEIYWHYIKCMGGLGWIFLYLLALIVTESMTVLGNNWMSYWSDHHAKDESMMMSSSSAGFSLFNDNSFFAKNFSTELLERQVTNTFANVMGILPDEVSSGLGIAVYFTLAVLSGVVFFCFILFRIFMGQAATRKLHMDCQSAVLRAKMSFLDTTPSGRIINRFAEDTVVLDNNLPNTFSLNIQWFYRLMMIFLMASFVSPWTLTLFLPIGLIFIKTQQYYVPSARELRRLDSINKSPLFSHIAETLHGLSTIRVHQMETTVTTDNLNKLSRQLSVYFLANSANRWLALRMQLTGALLVCGVCTLSIVFRQALAAGIVGLAVMYSFRLTDTLNALNRESADLETQMISVERLKQYGDENIVPPEAALHDSKFRDRPENRVWPSKGEVHFHNVQLKYREELPLVLHGITLKIPYGTSMGICGRTGSGKSSLLLSLMRIVEPSAGKQLIDGVDISQIGLHDLRKNLCIIPQDPVILSGTVRFNMDPFNECTNERIQKAIILAQLESKLGLQQSLEKIAKIFRDNSYPLERADLPNLMNAIRAQTELKADSILKKICEEVKSLDIDSNLKIDEIKEKLISMLPNINLEIEVSESGSNFSHGERQLLALCRAILRKPEGGSFNGILLLDEATSALDHELDQRIQKIIRQDVFKNSTIVTIAHRIQTVADYDNVAVLDNGHLIECGNPQTLLQDPGSRFFALANGNQME